MVDRQLERAIRVPREELLKRHPRAVGEQFRVPLVTTYFPGAEKLRHILRNLQHILDSDSKCREAFPHRPLLAIRQPPNLRQILVRSKLPDLTHSNSVQKCCNTKCKTCPVLDTDAAISRDNHTNHITRGNFTCKSKDVIYLIRCKHGCDNAWYIGETSQPLHIRLNGHRHDTIRSNYTKPVSEHFSSHGHSKDDMKINILQGPIHNTTLRRAMEQKLVDKFDTHQRGLNRDRGCMSHYVITTTNNDNINAQ